MLAVLKVAALTVFGATVAVLDSASAQIRCEPTISKPCNPASTNSPQPGARPTTTMAPNTLSNTLREPAAPPREKTKLDPVPVLPEIKIDKDTSMGFGQGGGVFGLERKF